MAKKKAAASPGVPIPVLDPNTAALYERYYTAALTGMLSHYGVGPMSPELLDSESDRIARYALSCQIDRHRALALALEEETG